MPQRDTIAAISTAWGEAGIAIVRVSGPDALPLALGTLRSGPSGALPPREMRLVSLLDEEGRPIDRALAVWFPGPRSYTGEDVVEIHVHGGTLVAQLCLEGLVRRGARVAEPGELTMRAFLNGRMDLSQAEAVLGIVRARSAEALRAAARTLTGELSSSILQICDEILDLQGSLEVGLDFPEGEPPQLGDEELRDALTTLEIGLSDLEDRCSLGMLLREGVRVVLAGRPNVGKSSLLNALLKQPRAIVTAHPGTTRDIIEEPITYRGVPLRLVDTAGIRAPLDEIEAMGIHRARAELREADVCSWLVDGSVSLEDEDHSHISGLDTDRSIVVLTKVDLPPVTTEEDIRSLAPDARVLSLSSKTGEGLEALKDAFLAISTRGGALDAGLNVSARQLEDIRTCSRALDDARHALDDGAGHDVVAGALGRARLALDGMLGISYDDALLRSIFGRFCVGK